MVPRYHLWPMIKAALLGAWALVAHGRFVRLGYKAFEFVSLLRHYGEEDGGVRMIACMECDLYNHARKTCGTAGQWYTHPGTGRKEPFGCWCYLPVKNQTRCNCWLYERLPNQGWPKFLNSFPND
jgi:hypothetical protein